jgi:hypothetical protein
MNFHFQADFATASLQPNEGSVTERQKAYITKVWEEIRFLNRQTSMHLLSCCENVSARYDSEKNGKLHRYYSVVENRRLRLGKIVPRAWIDYYISQHVSCSGGVTQIMSISGCGPDPVEYERHSCEHTLEGIPPGHSYNPKRENVGIPENWPWNY